MKKIISFVLSIVIFTSIIPNCAFASEQEVLAQYSGSTTASYGYKPNCTFTVNKIVDDKFRGTFSATNLGIYNISQSVEGQVYENYDSFTCVFSLDSYYNTSFVITVYPFEGYCECISSGTWHFVDFRMNGTKLTFNTNSEISGNAEFDESDLIMCMLLSSAAYKKKYKNNQLIPLKECIVANEFDLDTENLRSYNYLDEDNNIDSNKNDVAFSITYRKIDENNVDLIVVIRGSYNDEWIGNAELTGETYDSAQKRHVNFSIAKDSIEKPIEQYLSQYLSQYQNVNLIITGHSRGAAVANLYAKEAIDQINGSTTIDGIPNFNKVTAYTFACPNVEKYNDTMENYSSIFNFCLCEDLVPTVPLTYPSDGWNYWKYGITYITDLDYKYFWNYTGIDNRNTRLSIYAIHAAFSEWNSVEEYYNKPIGEDDDYTTLYNFFSQTASEWKSVNSKPELYIRINNLIKRTKRYPEIGNLVKNIAKGADSVLAHLADVYEPTIENFNHVDRNGVSLYRRYTYQNCLYDFENKGHFADNINNQNSRAINDKSFNENEKTKLETIYNNNSNVLEWNLLDPSTWEGITWNADGNVESIDLSFKNLSGELDLSGFSSLKSLDLSGNEITGVTLSNCSSLEEIDCSFNKLTSLDLSDCTSLTSVTCCYNYLDTHEGGTLYNTLDDLMFDDVYVNYYPQSVPDNATFNTAELNALKTFANIDSNNSVLDWLDEDGNIDTNKLQNNVLFEYDGNNYRIAAIDISELEITGSLDLTAFSQLKELYCSQTGITSVNVNNCTKLEIIDCSDSQLSMLTLPSNSSDKNTPLYKVMCENNHLDINIFTDDIIKYVTFKAGSQLDYKHQIINASADEFDENDYNALCAFANQKDNLSSLDWDLTAPGEWDYVNWKLDTVSGKYKLLDCYFDCLDITGDIDLSGCTALEYASFSGSDIETAKLPVLTEKRYAAGTVETASLGANENAFYDCPKLEAVVISPLAEKIESGAFYNCKALQAVYVPESVISIADNSFGNCPNLTLAGADETTVSEYAFENSISFEEGYFLCARVNCQENTSGTFSAYYPIEDAQIINGDTVCAQTDEYGFFTVFGLEDGQYSYTVSYKFGFNVPLIASISGGCKTVTPPIAMPALNFNRDGYITVRDYTMLVRITQDSEDFKYYDINRDSVIDDVEKNLFTGLWNMAASDVISYNV